ncbi:MAG TPA: aquaporin [Schlesneria sp.]
MRSEFRKLSAELFGTFALVFAGTGAIVINDVSGGTVTHVGISLTFGMIVMAMIFALGGVSGAHLNPAVTIGLFAARRMEGRMVVAYGASQFFGAFLGSVVLCMMFPGHPTLGATIPAGSTIQAFSLEFLLTMILMFVVLSMSEGSKEQRGLIGLVVGSVVALEALFAGPITGASMNPARSMAPAVVTGCFEYLWVYLTAPVAGALAGVAVCSLVHGPACCRSPRKCDLIIESAL